MTTEQEKLLAAVEKINGELKEKYLKKDKKDPYKNWRSLTPMLNVTFGGKYSSVSLSIPYREELPLPEIPLYFSENDSRIYYEKSDKHETYYKFLKRRFLEVKEEIYSVKL